MNKKTRNVLSGLLVGLASVFAIINFADIPADEAGKFLLSTAIFFFSIVILAFVAVSFFKLLGWLRTAMTSSEKTAEAEEKDGKQKGDELENDALTHQMSDNEDKE